LGYPGDVIARTIEAFHQAKSDWVACGFEHDRNHGPGVLGSQRPRGRRRRDDGDLPVDEIRCEARQPVEMTFGPAVFDADVLTFNVTSFLQPRAECVLKECARVGSSDTLRNPITGLAGCCACAAGGQSAVATINSRRRICCPGSETLELA